MRQFFDDILTWYLGLSVSDESSNLQRHWRFEAAWNWQTMPVLLSMFFVLALAIWLLRVNLRRQSRKLFVLLLTLRCSILFMLALVILQVQLKTVIFGKPGLVFLIDSSASMSLTDHYVAADLNRLKRSGVTQTSESRIDILKQFFSQSQSDWYRDLQQTYEITPYTFDSNLHESELIPTGDVSIPQWVSKIQANGISTDFQTSLDELVQKVRDQTPAAIVLFSDGRATTHMASATSQIEKKFQRLRLPVFTVGFGAPANSIDIVLEDIEFEPVGFTGDEHAVSVSISTNETITNSVQLVAKNSLTKEVVNSVTLAKITRDQKAEATLLIPHLGAGRNEFQIEIMSAIGENELQNNTQLIHIWGRNAKLNVLFIEHEPRWEFRHLKTAMERDRNLSIETFLFAGDPAYAVEDRTALSQLPESLENYDAVILGDIDFNLLPQNYDLILEDFVENNGGLLLLSGRRSFESLDLTSHISELHPTLTRLPEGIQRRQVNVKPTPEGEAQHLFPVLSEEHDQAAMPELYALEYDLSSKPSALTLLEGKRGDSSFKPLPLVLSMRYGSGLVTQHLVDDLWRWRVVANGEFFRKYWAQTIRNLCRQKLIEELPPLELTSNRNQYHSSDSAEIILIDRLEQLQLQDAIPVIWDLNGQTGGELTLHRSNSDSTTFSGMMTSLQPGSYTLSLLSNDEKLNSVRSQFEVVETNSEEEYHPFQKTFLQKLSEKNQGQFYFPWELNQLQSELPETQYMTNSKTLIIPIWNRWEMILLLLGVFAVEWIVRRRTGLD